MKIIRDKERDKKPFAIIKELGEILSNNKSNKIKIVKNEKILNKKTIDEIIEKQKKY